jgi:hypothetical protein
MPKALLMARADAGPSAGRRGGDFGGRRAATEVRRHREEQARRWREFWRRPPATRSELLVELLREQLAKLIRGANPAEIDVTRPIFELGVDSLLMTEWQGTADLVSFGAAVPGLMTSNRSIESLADELAKLLNERF